MEKTIENKVLWHDKRTTCLPGETVYLHEEKLYTGVSFVQVIEHRLQLTPLTADQEKYLRYCELLNQPPRSRP